MSNVLVIHPTDSSTEFLKLCYEGKGYDVITDCHIKRKELIKQIEDHDKIIMMGHGTPAGLLNPGAGGYLIDKDLKPLLSTKETMSIWCHSDMFFRPARMKGFHTGMIISEVGEEHWVLGNAPLDRNQMLENMKLFGTALGECIDQEPDKIREHMLERYTGDDAVTEFNRGNLIVLK